MGTSIELTVGGVSLDYAKNHMGNDWGFLFQDGDLTRRRTEAIEYEYYAEHPEEADELKVAEETLIRPLVRVLSRLNLLGHTLETARAEYQAVMTEFDASDDDSDDEGDDKRAHMSFAEFCWLANRFPLDELSGAYVEFETPDRDIVARGRFAALADEFSRIPWTGSQNMYWSEKSYLSDKICILSAGSMLQVFGLNPANRTAEVEWGFGPVVHAGWVEREAIEPGVRRARPYWLPPKVRLTPAFWERLSMLCVLTCQIFFDSLMAMSATISGARAIS